MAAIYFFLSFLHDKVRKNYELNFRNPLEPL